MAIATSFTHLYRIDNDKLLRDKKTIISKSDVLEYIDVPIGLNDVGGLDLVKDYIVKYAAAHSNEAKEFGVEPLKGFILTGVPGTGKSLIAKVIGKAWGVPLLRLDVGKVMTGLVGGSEGRMREVIAQAEAMSPCLLWLDEVEKSLSGTKSSNFSDGGTLSRVFGTLLTAMQDGLEGVTIVATANDITMLPPEFIRRFNEVFFVDLPTEEERWEILGIHLGKRKRDIKDFTEHKDALLELTKDFTGAELEKVVKDAIAASYYNNKEKLNFTHLSNAIEETKPIAKLMPDKIQAIRETALGQYRFASSASEKKNNKKTKTKKSSSLDFATSNNGTEKANKLFF
jgi:SpoVK/Ycf46/Vps4 family AAA+-type ATPase